MQHLAISRNAKVLYSDNNLGENAMALPMLDKAADRE
jgi:hypothetical protein